MNDMVKVADLARELQKPKVVRNRIDKLGITPVIAPGITPIGQRRDHQYITPEEADRVKASIAADKPRPASRAGSPPKRGVLYVAAIPPGSLRVKVGWSNDMADRLTDFRTLVPDVEVVALWDCPQQELEKAAIYAIKRRLVEQERSVRQVGNEVFEGDSDSILRILDEVFAASGLERIQ